MKRKGIWTIVSVLVVLGLILAGCAKAPAPAAPTAPTTPTAPAPKAPTAPVTPVAPAPPKLIKWTGQVAVPGAPEERFNPVLGSVTSYYLSDVIEKQFPGRIKIEWTPMGSVVPEAEMMMAIGAGTLNLGGVYAGFHAGILPEADVEIGPPFSFQTAADGYDALWNFGLRDYLQEVYAERNIWAEFSNANYLQGSGGYTFMANSPADLKGKRFRAVGIYQKWYEKLGASATLISWGEMYMALKLGTIDGILLSVPALDTIKVKEVLKSWVVYPNTLSFNSNMLFNRDSLNALPDDIRSFIMGETRHILAYFGQVRTANEQWFRVNRAEREGYIKQIRWSEADTKYVMDIGFALWDEVAKKGPRVARGIEILRKQMRDYGRMK